MDRNPTVLVVDDEAFFRDFLRLSLEEDGYRLLFASNGPQALKLAAEHAPDLILLDVIMPGMDGYEVLDRIRADPALREIPVVMITGLEDRQSKLAGLEAGADDFVSKPCNRTELRARVRGITRLNRFRKLLEERDRLARLLESCPTGIGVVSHEGEVLMANRALEGLLDAAPLTGRQVPDLVREGESELQRRDGELVQVLINACDIAWEGQPAVLSNVRDVTDLKRYQAELERHLNFDSLTGLANRTLLRDRLQQALAAARADGHSVALLVLGLDDFKRINQAMGIERGDRLLREVADRLAGCVLRDETVARAGADEFALVLTDLARPDQAVERARLVLSRLKPPFEGDISLTGSIVITLFPRDGQTAEQLISHALLAAHRSRQEGAGSFRFYSPEMQALAQGRLELEAALRRALDEEALELHYQPKISLDTGQVVGAEALLRWPRDGEFVLPHDFIPLAEETGLILPLGEWVIERACRQMRDWDRDGVPYSNVAVNISARQLHEQDLTQVCRQALRQNALAPRSLQLELTESMVMREPARVLELLQDLRALGLKLALDDFGTGYSSLACLRSFPIDFLKIDQSFIRHMLADPGQRAIVDATVQLARSLGFAAIAEGVESQEQMRYLARLGCQQMQGYYFSRPVPPQEFSELLARGRRLRPLHAPAPRIRTAVKV